MKRKKAMIKAGICAAALAISAVFCKPVRWMLYPFSRVHGTVHITVDGQPYYDFTNHERKISHGSPHLGDLCYHDWQNGALYEGFAKKVEYKTNGAEKLWVILNFAAPKWWSAVRYDITYDLSSKSRDVNVSGTARMIDQHGEWVDCDYLYTPRRVIPQTEAAAFGETPQHLDMYIEHNMGVRYETETLAENRNGLYEHSASADPRLHKLYRITTSQRRRHNETQKSNDKSRHLCSSTGDLRSLLQAHPLDAVSFQQSAGHCAYHRGRSALLRAHRQRLQDQTQ